MDIKDFTLDTIEQQLKLSQANVRELVKTIFFNHPDEKIVDQQFIAFVRGAVSYLTNDEKKYLANAILNAMNVLELAEERQGLNNHVASETLYRIFNMVG
jgi:hypothetical protein